MSTPLTFFSLFRKETSERQEIAEVRGKILGSLLYVFSLLGLPAITIGTYQAYVQGRWVFAVAYAVIYLFFLLATFASRQNNSPGGFFLPSSHKKTEYSEPRL